MKRGLIDNKKGQGLSLNAIVLIVLGVLVLVILIVGFTVGWKNLAPWVEDNNIDTVVEQCNLACNVGSKTDFCSKQRELSFDQETMDLPDLEPYSENEKTYTCEELVGKGIGVESCSSISCEQENN